MGKQLRAVIEFTLLVLICHGNVTSSRIDGLPQDASSIATLLASHQAQPDLNRTTAHVRPTASVSSTNARLQTNSSRNSTTHRDRATVAALNIQAVQNSSRIAAASSQQHASMVASPGPQQAGSPLATARAKWRQMELALASAHSAASLELKRTLDQLGSVLAKQDKQISNACNQSLDELVIGLSEQELWASQMFDASAGHRRLPSGLLEGTLTELGNFDECLAIRHSDGGGKGKPERGQYCSVLIKPPLANRPRLHTICRRLPSLSATPQTPAINSSLRLLAQHSHQFYYAGLRLGLCLPSRCSQTDVHHLLQAYLIKYELVGQVKHCQREPAEELRLTNSTTKSLLLDNPLVSSISHNFDLTQQCILFTFLCLAIMVVLGTWLDGFGRHERVTTTTATTILSGLIHDNQLSQPTSDPHSLAGKRARHYRVCHGSNSTSCCSKDRAAGYSDDDLGREQSDKNGAIPPLGLQKNPLVELSGAQIDLDTGKTRSHTRIESLSGCAAGADGQPSRAARVADSHSATCIETLPLFLEREQEQLIGAASSSPPISKSNLREFLICFSLRQNIRSIGKLTPSQADANHCQTIGSESGHDPASSMADLKVVHGLRTLSMIWIIFGHTVGLVSPEMMNNLFALASLSCTSRLLQAILNTTLAVDTFFMISGLVTVIGFVRKCKSARDLIEPPPVPSAGMTSATVWPHTLVAGANTGDIEVSSVDSSNSAITSMSSSASSNRCIGRASKSSSQKNFIVNKTLRSCEPHSRRQSRSNDSGWPSDFQPLVWMLLRYLRLTPAYAAMIGLSIVMPTLGSGPFWPETVGQLGFTCRANWWTNLLYVNNFIETDKLCLIHSWYLSNDWQFFLLALVLFGVFYKSRKLTLILLVGAFVASSATTFIVTTEYDYPPTIVTTSPAIAERWQFIHSLYYKPWPHMPAYLIGLIVGYAILKFQFSHGHRHRLRVGKFPLPGLSLRSQVDLAPGTRLLAWFMFSLISFAVLNSIYPWNMGLQVDPIITGLHAATFRTLWAACCAWLVFALVSRPRNPLGLLLSWHGFQVTSRLTYCAYLVHPLAIYYHFGTIRERIDSSPYGQLQRFLATLLMSYLFAFVVSLLIESPSIQVQKFLIKLFRSTDNDDEDDTPKDRSTRSLVDHERAGPSSNRRESSPCCDYAQPEYSNSDSLARHILENDCASDRHPCKSIPIAPPARSRAHLGTKSVRAVGQGSMAGPVLATGECLHATHKLADMTGGCLASSDGHELSDGGCSSNCSNHSVVDEEFQRKLAQAIGRGFKIRSRIVNGTLDQVRPGSKAAARKSVTMREGLTGGQPLGSRSDSRVSPIDYCKRDLRQEFESTSDKPLSTINGRPSFLSTFLSADKQTRA